MAKTKKSAPVAPLTERERETHAALSEAFEVMNTYAADPWNMGGDARTVSRIEPQAIIGQVYLILAPVQVKLQAASRTARKEEK